MLPVIIVVTADTALPPDSTLGLVDGNGIVAAGRTEEVAGFYRQVAGNEVHGAAQSVTAGAARSARLGDIAADSGGAITADAAPTTGATDAAGYRARGKAAVYNIELAAKDGDGSAQRVASGSSRHGRGHRARR